MRTILLGLIVIVVAGCAAVPQEPRWIGDDVHVVDGYVVSFEAPCPSDDAPDCGVEVAAARKTLSEERLASIRSISMLGGPSSWVDEQGRYNIRARSGFISLHAVAFTFDDGSRKIVPLHCGPGLLDAPENRDPNAYGCRPGTRGLPRADDPVAWDEGVER